MQIRRYLVQGLRDDDTRGLTEPAADARASALSSHRREVTKRGAIHSLAHQLPYAKPAVRRTAPQQISASAARPRTTSRGYLYARDTSVTPVRRSSDGGTRLAHGLEKTRRVGTPRVARRRLTHVPAWVMGAPSGVPPAVPPGHGAPVVASSHPGSRRAPARARALRRRPRARGRRAGDVTPPLTAAARRRRERGAPARGSRKPPRTSCRRCSPRA